MGASGAGRSSAAFRRWRRAVRGDCCWVRFMEPVFVLDVAFMEFVTTLLWRAVCQKKEKKKKNTWKPDAIKLLICTSVTLTNAVTTTGHEMDQRRCYSFFFFFFSFLFNYHCCYANCVKLLQTPCFQKICHEEAKEALFHCKCQWIIPRWLIYPPNHTRWRSRRRIIITLNSSVLGWDPLRVNAIQMHFWSETFCTRAFLLKTGHFLIYLFILTTLFFFFFFFLYLVHVYIVSRIAQKRNNIKCIIFVVLNWLLLICLTLPVTSAAADKEQQPEPSSSQHSQIECDSNITDWDIYLYSTHCESQIKWLEEQNNAAGYI